MIPEIEDVIEKGSISSKREYYSLYEAGFFGNKVRTWNSIDEAVESGWDGKICVRSKRRILRSLTKFNLSIEEAREYVKYLKNLKEFKIDPKDLTFNQSMPDNELVIQGEIMASPEHYTLTYSTVKKPMNVALAEKMLHAEGLKALYLVKNRMSPSSYEDLTSLMEIFPSSVFEFSTYRTTVGNLKNRNTIIWEVRNY